MQQERLTVRGKFFFLGEKKYFLQGVSYGPFPFEENALSYDKGFKSPQETEEDFKLICQGGWNTLRVYHVPSSWFMDLATTYGLKVLITVPWESRTLFLDDKSVLKKIKMRLDAAARLHAGHPALFGYLVDNEIPPDLVRWYGAERIEAFIDSLVHAVKRVDPTALCSYANYPSTEYLQPAAVDFYCFNIYLHNSEKLSAYLDRLQNIAEDKPLILGEFGMDTQRHSEQEQADLLAGQFQMALQRGLAGVVAFSWTDEWFTNGLLVEDWAFGLVRVDRSPKLAYKTMQKKLLGKNEILQEKYPLSRTPKVSVVVCSYNGGSTLRACLESMRKLNYSDYEVILIDDGSTDNTQAIARDFPEIHNFKQENKGLSVARNKGIELSTGEIIAYTDSDCMVDPDWLYYLVQELLEGKYVAVGGPNISPPAAHHIQAAVIAAPGGPSHVLINDTDAEHIPGCNMAFWKSGLVEIGGFDKAFRRAGDDVDICWRLLQAGFYIGYCPGAVVLHYRRFSVRAFFLQQHGYGEAEALLRYKHFEHFESTGEALWRGVIYGQPRCSLRHPLIYHGIFGTGFFQTLYTRSTERWSDWINSIEWLSATLAIAVAAWQWHFLRSVAALMAIMMLVQPIQYASRVKIQRAYDKWNTRFILFYLAWMQPLVREWARYFVWIQSKKAPELKHIQFSHLPVSLLEAGHLAFKNEKSEDRLPLLKEMKHLLKEEGWRFALDHGWNNWDITIFGNRCWYLRLKTLTEIYPSGKRVVRVRTVLQPSRFFLLSSILSSSFFMVFQFWFVAFLAMILMLVTCWDGLLLRLRIGCLVHQAAMCFNWERIKV